MEWPDKDSTLSFADFNEPFKLYTDTYFKGLEVVFYEEKMRKSICGICEIYGAHLKAKSSALFRMWRF